MSKPTSNHAMNDAIRRAAGKLPDEPEPDEGDQTGRGSTTTTPAARASGGRLRSKGNAGSGTGAPVVTRRRVNMNDFLREAADRQQYRKERESR